MFRVRVATPADTDAVATVLLASYPKLMAPAYPPEVLAPALALMTRPNPSLLSSGTFFVAERDGTVIGCGGWTPGRPDLGASDIRATVGHVRQFAVHPGWLRRGVGTALIERSAADAAAAGVECLACASSLVAVAFYRSAGFVELDRETMMLSPGVPMETVAMERRLVPA